MKKLDVRKLVLNALLLAIGIILHQIEPAIFGVKPDMMLIMLFVVLLLNKKDFKTSISCGIIAGLFAAMTTAFPGGQIPNIIDKVLTTIICYFMIKLLEEKVNDTVLTALVIVIGTAVSGFIFLFTAQLLVGLPGGMTLTALFVAVVVPAIIINVVLGIVTAKVSNKVIGGEI